MVTESSKQRMFDIQSTYFNHVCVLGLSRDLLCLIVNIPTVVGITHRGHGCGCEVYVLLILICLRRGVGDMKVHNQGGHYQSAGIFDYSNPYTDLIRVFLVTYLGFLSTPQNI